MTRPFRRRVFYVPGFDPMPPRRYRELYRRESRRQAQVGGFDLTVEKPAGGAAFGWQTRACFPEGMARAQVEDGSNPDAVELAQTIIDAQTTEIQEMQDLLATL